MRALSVWLCRFDQPLSLVAAEAVVVGMSLGFLAVGVASYAKRVEYARLGIVTPDYASQSCSVFVRPSLRLSIYQVGRLINTSIDVIWFAPLPGDSPLASYHLGARAATKAEMALWANCLRFHSEIIELRP